MPRFNALSRWLAATITLLFLTVSAHAQEEPDGAGGVMDEMDKAFGEWFVAPLFSVLFYDVYFFDNTLDDEGMYTPIYGNKALDITLLELEAAQVEDPFMGAMTRVVHDADVAEEPLLTGTEPLFQRAIGIDEDGLVQQADYTIVNGSAFLPVLEEPVERVFGVGGIEVLVSNRDNQLYGVVTGGDVNLAALGISLGDAQMVADDGSEVLLAVESPELPGITLSVTASGEVRGGEGVLPRDTIPLTSGMTITDGTLTGELAVLSETGRGLLMTPGTALETTFTTNPRNLKIPFVVFWLVLGALFFTLRMMFVNLRMFPHAIAVTMGRYDHEDDPGEISHFQALSSALSATVGLGNIAGVALAVGMGGPGAVFWMIVAGALGMSAKFVECTLGQMYRKVDANGVVSGGPMHYLSRGIVELGERNFGASGKMVGRIVGYPLAAVFALMCIGASFGGGNMFQANQSFAALSNVASTLVPALGTEGAVFWMSLIYGVVLAAIVGVVILGGIKRIGVAAGIIVPLMCGMYLLAGIGVLVINADQVPHAIALIVGQAFSPAAGIGGLLGVLVVGFQRAAFSNEAGVGSASIAHSAASTPEPVREGIVSLLEPFIDTILVCTMTGLVVVVTGAYLQDTGDGVLMTSYAFATVFWWFPYLLTLAVVMFAFSTMISWSYYGERAAVWLFGEWARWPYKATFLVFVVFGSVFKLGNVLDFSDLMVLGMAVPNIFGAVLLSGHVKRALDEYITKLRTGGFTTSSAPEAS